MDGINENMNEKTNENVSENMSEKENAREQAQKIDRELQSLQQQIDAVDEEMTPDRMGEIMQLGEQIAEELNQPEKG